MSNSFIGNKEVDEFMKDLDKNRDSSIFKYGEVDDHYLISKADSTTTLPEKMTVETGYR